MLSMAFSAADLAMLAGCALPLYVNVAVTGITGFQLNITRKGDSQRLVNRVALLTGCFGLSIEMWLVALGALWNVAVTIMVTAVAFLFGMFARELLQLGILRAVAVTTDAGQHMSHRHAIRSVRVFVTVQTLYMLGSVWLTMAGRALWHDLSVIFL